MLVFKRYQSIINTQLIAAVAILKTVSIRYYRKLAELGKVKSVRFSLKTL